jgi:hypothetical protein
MRSGPPETLAGGSGELTGEGFHVVAHRLVGIDRGPTEPDPPEAPRLLGDLQDLGRGRARHDAGVVLEGDLGGGGKVVRPREGDVDAAHFFLLYQSISIWAKCAHFSGSSSRGKIAWTGQTGTQAPQSMQVSGSM